MALIKCHECGHQVSTEAQKCPSCGAPVQAVQAAATLGHALNRPVTMFGMSPIVLIGGGFLALCVAFAAWGLIYGSKTAVPSSPANPSSSIPAKPRAELKLTPTQARFECRLEQEIESIMLRHLVDKSGSREQESADALGSFGLDRLRAQYPRVVFASGAEDQAKVIASTALIPSPNVRDAALEAAESQARFDQCLAIESAAGSAVNSLVDVAKTDWSVVPTEKLQSIKGPLNAQEQAVADLRSAATKNLEKYEGLVSSVVVAFNCKLVDEGTATAALLNVESAMQQELIRAGLMGDPRMAHIAMNIEGAGKESALEKVKAGVCEHLSDEQRGQLRIGLGSLARGP